MDAVGTQKTSRDPISRHMKPFDHQAGNSIPIHGTQIYVEQTGDPTGHPVLYLPGGFGHIGEFNSVIPSLPNHLRLVGIDSRGHGKSTMGDCKLNYAQLEDDVLAVIEQLQLDEVSLVGNSDGGIVAMRLAAGGRCNVQSVLTIGAHWQVADDDPVREDFKQITPGSWRAEFPQTYEEYMSLNPEPDFERFAEDVLGMWLDDDPATGYPGEAVRRIACEMLIVLGANDPYLTRESMEALASRVPKAKLATVADAGHAVHDDQRDALVDLFKRFFESVG
ncbi:MAG TPA: hypothetical protein DCM28_16175 [Phycisphaerales bacterium]|nr:hypothetical protein [Phycisphaerales bacterium]